MKSARMLLVGAALLMAGCATAGQSNGDQRQDFQSFDTTLARVQTPEELIKFVVECPDDKFRYEPTMLHYVKLVSNEASLRKVEKFIKLGDEKMATLLRNVNLSSGDEIYRCLVQLLNLMEITGVTRRPEPGRPMLLDLAQQRSGQCSSLVAYLLCLVERHQLPIRAVELPHHIFLRIRIGKNTWNFETLNPMDPHWWTEARYLRDYEGCEKFIRNNETFLMEKRLRLTALALLVQDFAVILEAKHEYKRILDICRVIKGVLGRESTAVLPNEAEAYLNLGANIETAEIYNADHLKRARELFEIWFSLDAANAEFVFKYACINYSILNDYKRTVELCTLLVRLLSSTDQRLPLVRTMYDDSKSKLKQ